MSNQDSLADVSAGPVAAGGALAIGGAAAATAYAGKDAFGTMAVDDNGVSQDGSANAAAASGAEVRAGGLTLYQASRFLTQATNGPTRSEIDALAEMGIEKWLSGQFAMLRHQSHWDWLEDQGVHADSKYRRSYRLKRLHWDRSIWKQLITAEDQLRQRVGLALLDILVVGIEGIKAEWAQFAMAAYMDLLLDHAFGNYRELLGAITTNSAMGDFLTFIGSSKADGKGSQPDENYARELMQLFTLGVHELNQDGTIRRDANGEPIETYTQRDVAELARVFTGLRRQSDNLATPEAHRQKLVIDPAHNEIGPCTYHGMTVSGGGMKAINAALDLIFWHPNVPPFVSRALIQRLVSSNPSPDYVRRVATIFADNGHGTRGDLRAVVHAILTDPEARSEAALAAPHTGKLRDPVQRFTGWARAFHARPKDGRWLIGDLSSPERALGQSPGRSPSVFNFFRPGYSPPNSELSRRGLVAPELQIVNEQSVIGFLNYMYVAVTLGAGGHRLIANHDWLLKKADDAWDLTEEVNLVLAAGQLSDSTKNMIYSAVESVDAGDRPRRLNNRIRAAIMLTLVAPEYLVVK